MINSKKGIATKTQSQKQEAVNTENTVKPKTIELGIDGTVKRSVNDNVIFHYR